jgi:hypothetical protein
MLLRSIQMNLAAHSAAILRPTGLAIAIKVEEGKIHEHHAVRPQPVVIEDTPTADDRLAPSNLPMRPPTPPHDLQASGPSRKSLPFG